MPNAAVKWRMISPEVLIGFRYINVTGNLDKSSLKLHVGFKA